MPEVGGKIPESASNKQYGDVTDLLRLGSGLKESEPGGLVVPRNPQGRPAEGGMVTQPGAVAPTVPEPTRQLMEDYAAASYLQGIGQSVAAMPEAGPWSRWYAREAAKRTATAEQLLALSTPNLLGT